MDAANLLKPMLAVASSVLLAAHTPTSTDSTSKRTPRSSVDSSRSSSTNHRRGLHRHPSRHSRQVRGPPRCFASSISAIVSAAQLAKRYLTDRLSSRLAIDLVDEPVPTSGSRGRRFLKKSTSSRGSVSSSRSPSTHSRERRMRNPSSRSRRPRSRSRPSSTSSRPSRRPSKRKRPRRRDQQRATQDGGGARQDRRSRASLRHCHRLGSQVLRASRSRDQAAAAAGRERKREEEGRNSDNNLSPPTPSLPSSRAGPASPLSRMLESEKNKLLRLERTLAKR